MQAIEDRVAVGGVERREVRGGVRARVELGLQIGRHLDVRGRVVGRVPAPVGLRALDLGDARRLHVAALDQLRDQPDVALGPLRARPPRRVLLQEVRLVAGLALAVDPAEAEGDVERLGDGDRLHAGALLGDLDPEAVGRRVVLLEPRPELVLACEGAFIHDLRRYSGEPMSKRPITALMAALALLAVAPAASFAQSPTPTAAAAQDDGTAADPPADASKEVKAVYTDYSRDGVIDVCDHTRDVLQEKLDGIDAAFDRDFPHFREAVKAGIQRHDKGSCDKATATPTATATATATASPDATATASPDDGTLPPATDDGGSGSGALPPATDDGTTNPQPEDGTLPP